MKYETRVKGPGNASDASIGKWTAKTEKKKLEQANRTSSEQQRNGNFDS